MNDVLAPQFVFFAHKVLFENHWAMCFLLIKFYLRIIGRTMF